MRVLLVDDENPCLNELSYLLSKQENEAQGQPGGGQSPKAGEREQAARAAATHLKKTA